jgi:hypothetical protein
LEILRLSRYLHRDRRVYSDHSVLLHERPRRRRLGLRDQHRRPFRGRRGEIADHPAVVVGVRLGDDNCRRDRSCRDLRPRPRLWRDLVKTQFLIIALVAGSCWNTSAQTFPIIDVRYGYLIGAIKSGKWIEPTDATKSVKTGAKLSVYGVTGSVGNASIVKLDTRNEPCPDHPVVKLNPRKMKQGAVAFSPNWNPVPRKPKPIEVNQKQHVDVVREFLRKHGLRDPIVHINQIVSVDLDGDGQDEFVIAATHYKNGDEIPDESSANTYSFVMIERVVDGQTKTELVDGEFYPEAKSDSAPNRFEIAALLDLNGDGKIDIVLRSAYYEGDEISVYEYRPMGAKKVLSVGCGL